MIGSLMETESRGGEDQMVNDDTYNGLHFRVGGHSPVLLWLLRKKVEHIFLVNKALTILYLIIPKLNLLNFMVYNRREGGNEENGE